MNYNKHKNFSFFILVLLCSYRQLSLKINVFGTISENNAPYMSGQFVCQYKTVHHFTGRPTSDCVAVAAPIFLYL